jgi:hypothetical protein
MKKIEVLMKNINLKFKNLYTHEKKSFVKSNQSVN